MLFSQRDATKRMEANCIRRVFVKSEPSRAVVETKQWQSWWPWWKSSYKKRLLRSNR